MEFNNNNLGVRRYFSKEFKQNLIEEHQKTGVSISVLARKNGIHPITLYQWKRAMTKDKNEVNAKELFEELERLKIENRALKSKVADLVVSNDILQYAVDFAKKKELSMKLNAAEQLKQKKSSKRKK